MKPTLRETSVEELVPDVANPNRGTDRGRDMVRQSLERLGAGRSIVLDGKGQVIAGNKTLAAAKEAGLSRVLVVETEGDTLVAVKRKDLDLDAGGKARELSVADNRASEVGLDWDAEVIAAQIDAGLDLSAYFTGDELEDLLAGLEEPSGLLDGADPDAIPDEVEPRCKAGDLWALGRHRLLCGDSTKAEAVARLMDGEDADLCFTSPPYDQQRNYGEKIGDWLGLMCGVFAVLPVHEKAHVLVNLGLVHREGEWRPYWDPWIAWMREQGWRSFGWYVWDQGAGLPGDWNGRLAPSHEFLFHFNRVAEKARKTKDCLHAGVVRSGAGLRKKDGTATAYSAGPLPVQQRKIPDSVFRIVRAKGGGMEHGHPAVFPVELVSEVMQAFSDPGDVFFDPFGGSGTAIIAGEQHGRSVRAMELEPSYVDIALARFEAATGETARRL